MLVLAGLVGVIGLIRVTRQIKQAAHPVISEINALNQSGLRDQDGELSDWIEIWNPTDESINLDGYCLSDNFRQIHRWRFPNRELTPGEFLIVFASGKNRNNPTNELHTNFRLTPDGEYLALVAPNGSRRVHEFLPKYPRQIGGISFGIRPDFFQVAEQRLSRKLDDMSFLLEPTPGAPNRNEMLGAVKNVSFGLKRGFYSGTTNVSLSTPTSGTEIRFTLDGSRPNETNGVVYTEPVEIERTTLLRAIAYRSGFLPSRIGSHTYLFPEQEIRKLDPTISTVSFEEVMAGFRNLPSISLMIPDTEDWRAYDAGRNLRSSLELIDPVQGAIRQIDCGVRISPLGPVTFGTRYKISFNVSIDNRFGDPEFKYPLFGNRKPRTFKELLLIGGTDTGEASSSLQTLVSDSWIRASASSLDRYAARSRFVHLFLNGGYRGIYNLAEHPETPFVSQTLQFVEPNYDVRLGSRQIAGDSIAWNALNALADSVNLGTAPVDSLASAIDVESFIDYSVLRLFAGVDGIDHNGRWMAVRLRDRNAPTEFMQTFTTTPMTNTWKDAGSLISRRQNPSRLFEVLGKDRRFQAAFARRVDKLFSPGGVLSAEASLDRFYFLEQQLTNAIDAEQLRWNLDPKSLDAIEDFLKQRPEIVREQISALVSE